MSAVDIQSVREWTRLVETVMGETNPSIPKISPPSSVGRFVVLEGIDGSGKTAVALRLQDALTEFLGRRVFFTKEPHDERLVSWLRHEEDHLSRLLMYLLDRRVHVRRIKQALSGGNWVLCDRYWHSTFVYNPVPVDRGWLDDERFRRVVMLLADDFAPDLTLWLDCPPETALERLVLRNTWEPMRDLELLEEAYHRYARLADSGLMVRIDASRPLESVVSDCLETIVSELMHGPAEDTEVRP
jgi:dTMP kinase